MGVFGVLILKQVYHVLSLEKKFISLIYLVLEGLVDNFLMSWTSIIVDAVYFTLIFLSFIEAILIVIHQLIAYVFLTIEVAETYGIFLIVFIFVLSKLISIVTIHREDFKDLLVSSNNLYNVTVYQSLILVRLASNKL